MKVMEKLQQLLAQYGKVAIITYFSIFFLVWAGFAVAIALGFQPKGAAGTAGVIGAAYVAVKLTQPLRIAATAVLTPLIARLVQGERRSSPPPETDKSPETNNE